MGKSEGMVIIYPKGDHMLRNGQYLGNSIAPLQQRSHEVSREDSHVCSMPRAAWMLQHLTISSHAPVKPGPGCRIFLAGKSHTAFSQGCLPLQWLFTASCLSHFASCHQCAWRTWHLTPCTGSPGSCSSCRHQWHPVLACYSMYLQRSQVTAAVRNVTEIFSALHKAKI